MAVDLASLIKAAPFSEDRKQKILVNLDKLSDNQKLKLTTAAWTGLSQMYFAKLNFENEKLLSEIRQGKRKFNKKDFEDIKEKLATEFAQKLKSAETQGSVDQIRQELKKQFRPQAPISPPTPS